MSDAASPFARSATFYDAIYAARGKDYAGEARQVLELAAARGVRRGRVLDVGCGTAAHLLHLQATFEPCGLDACRPMLEVARARLPSATLILGDMTAFEAPGPFDLVTCLFASIGYLPDRDALGRAVAAMAAQLRPGGVLVLEPAITPDRLQPPEEQRTEVAVPGGHARRRTTARRDGDALLIRFDYELTRGPVTDRFREVHRIALFTDGTYLEALAAAHLEVDRVDDGSPLFVATRD